MSGGVNRIGKGALLLLSGAAIGVGAALLLAPQSGEETRKDLARFARKTKRRAEDLSGNVSDVIHAVEDTAGNVLRRGNRIARKAKKELMTVIEEGRDRISRMTA